ncbi:GntR family transcriptional regulator [Saccharopolyspora kobensis]|uniref:GntR family transcriptional regulator n=1 Tax=Saccharopolyspora kobensis TaxID=146035 RepID=A0A1H6DZ05_9PSEU|nr:GntR family transcriptional regulator [Saccharopolyspora kobensis]SFD92138.1 transcriptional regulator, GntR family [Saccharopolyspora kobensis]
MGTVPVHHQIADELRSRIASGQLQPGDKLPTIAELTKAWDCAPLTARKAIEVLREEGRITGGRGKAPTVRGATARTPIRLADGWTQKQKDLVLRPAEERKVMGAIELTAGVPIAECESTAKYRETEANAEQAEIFGLPEGTKLIERVYEMVHKTTGVRMTWSVSYIPLQYIESNPELLDDSNEPWPGGHQHQLYTVGIELIEFSRSVIAVQPTPGERQKWAMEVGTPMLHTLSKSIDVEGRVVEYSEARYPADRTEIRMTEHLKRWTPEQLAEAADAAGDA